MSETLKSPTAENQPSVLDAEIDKAQNSLRGRITRRLGRVITGKGHSLEIVSGREADLNAIKQAGSTEKSFDEARNQLEEVQGGRKTKLAKLVMRATGNGEYVTKKEAALEGVVSELKDELAPSEAVLGEAYAMNTMHDSSRAEIQAHEDLQQSWGEQRSIDSQIDRKKAEDPSVPASTETLAIVKGLNNLDQDRANALRNEAIARHNQAALDAEDARRRQLADQVRESRRAA